MTTPTPRGAEQGTSRRRQPGSRGRSRWRAAAVAGAASLLLAPSLARPSQIERLDDPSGSALARRAVALCQEAASEAPHRDPLPALERGLALAEQAVALDGDDALAHFSVFCNLGRQLERSGLGLGAPTSLARARGALDRALALSPRFVDALVAKGVMLSELPWLLGGDDAEAERLIRAAIAIAPEHGGARVELARLLARHGDASAPVEHAGEPDDAGNPGGVQARRQAPATSDAAIARAAPRSHGGS